MTTFHRFPGALRNRQSPVVTRERHRNVTNDRDKREYKAPTPNEIFHVILVDLNDFLINFPSFLADANIFLLF